MSLRHNLEVCVGDSDEEVRTAFPHSSHTVQILINDQFVFFGMEPTDLKATTSGPDNSGSQRRYSAAVGSIRTLDVQI